MLSIFSCTSRPSVWRQLMDLFDCCWFSTTRFHPLACSAHPTTKPRPGLFTSSPLPHDCLCDHQATVISHVAHYNCLLASIFATGSSNSKLTFSEHKSSNIPSLHKAFSILPGQPESNPNSEGPIYYLASDYLPNPASLLLFLFSKHAIDCLKPFIFSFFSLQSSSLYLPLAEPQSTTKVFIYSHIQN